MSRKQDNANSCAYVILISIPIALFIVPETRGFMVFLLFSAISLAVLIGIWKVVGSVNERRRKEKQEEIEKEERKKQLLVWQQEQAQHQEREKREREKRERKELLLKMQQEVKQRKEEHQRRFEENKRRREEARRREEEERNKQIEELLERDAIRDRVHYMTGIEFELFMAGVFRKKGYSVQVTPASGDQGVDILLNIDNRTVAVQLKRYTGPVGNAAVQAAFSGMIYYKAREAWVITTSSFTKSATALAKSTGVRLIAGDELADWLNDLRDELL